MPTRRKCAAGYPILLRSNRYSVCVLVSRGRRHTDWGVEAIERRPQFLLDGFIARRELIAEEMEQRKIHLIGPVRVSGMHLRVNVRGIVEEQIEDKLALMIVGTDHLGVYRDMIGNQGIGHYSLVETKIFRE